MRHFTSFIPTLLLLLNFAAMLNAQEPAQKTLAPCGTPPWTDPWLRAYLADPDRFATARSNDTLWVGLQVHLVGRDNGTGRLSYDRFLNAFCRLNQDFAPAGIRFFMKYDWNLVDSSGWFEHELLEDGIRMMFDNNVPDALNIYFVADPAGNAGYNIPYAGIAISNTYAGPNEHTWAHEVGHALTLQHPFIGWEGKVYNYAAPTPDTLTYDYTHFHAQPDTIVPAEPDTALVEYADGSNCGIAADKFCDTPPDYLSYRWDCDAQGFSLVKQKDPAGNDFYSDGSLFMSYSNDVCANRFSDEETAAMRANLLSVKQSWLAPAPEEGLIDGIPQLISPVDGQTAPSAGAVLQWNATGGATNYLVQASRFSSFAIKEVDAVTADTFYTVGQLSPNKTYFWRARPFNNWWVCTGFSEAGSFKTELVSGLGGDPQERSFRCFPSLLTAGQRLSVQIPESWKDRPVQCRIFDPLGRLVLTEERIFTQSINPADWFSVQRQAGVYHITLQCGGRFGSVPVAVIR